MRAEVGEVPCTCSVMPVEPAWARALAICELLSVSRTTPPVSTLPAEHGASVAKASEYDSPEDGTLSAVTSALYRPAAPLVILTMSGGLPCLENVRPIG